MNRSALLLLSVLLTVFMAVVATQIKEATDRNDITASYEVNGDAITLVEGIPEEWHASAWSRWVELVPASARWRVGRFEAIAGSVEGQVEPLSDSLQVWSLRIAELEDDSRDNALVHELGHLVSLGPSEVVPATDPGVEQQCVTYFSMEGCAIPGKLFDRFVTAFWDVEEGWKKGDKAAERRYQAAPDSFVTSYAATNPGEDIAETFVYFVYTLRPSGISVAEQKIALLWEFPELVELRAFLRRRLSG